MTQHGPWQIFESHEVYRDFWIAVRKDDVVRPDGNLGTHSVVTVKPGVTVLAMDDERNVYLTEEFHYGVGRITIEAVSGGIEPDERPSKRPNVSFERNLELKPKNGSTWASLIRSQPVWFHRPSFISPGSSGSEIKHPKGPNRSGA